MRRIGTKCTRSSAGATVAASFARLILSGMCVAALLSATEGGTSVYPAGVETVLPGMLPGAGGTMLLEFNQSYVANSLVNAKGQSEIPGFHLRVAAFAPKLVHNWGLNVAGGTLVSSIALPAVYIHLSAPFGQGHKAGMANPDIGVAAVYYQRGALRFWYGLDTYAPSPKYNKNDLVNIGQHNWAVAPQGAFTYLPDKGRTEISSKFQYIVNYTNPITQYRSGNEFTWEYDAMRNITKVVAVGANGFFYNQTTDDRVNGAVTPTGNRSRDFALGPEVRCHFRHYALIAKYERDISAQNKTVGNAFWLQFGIPLSRGHE